MKRRDGGASFRGARYRKSGAERLSMPSPFTQPRRATVSQSQLGFCDAATLPDHRITGFDCSLWWQGKANPIWAFFPFSSDGVACLSISHFDGCVACPGIAWTWALPLRQVATTIDRQVARRRCPAFSAVSCPRRRARTGTAVCASAFLQIKLSNSFYIFFFQRWFR
jgi:hypothetical protein